MDRRKERAIIKSVFPKIRSVADEIWMDFLPNIPVDTGELRNDAYMTVDDQTGVIEFGYDETGSDHPHGVHVETGTSDMEARPVIRNAATKMRRDR